MKLLLDTHLLICAAEGIEHVPPRAPDLLAAPENELYFSAANILEIAIKNSLTARIFTSMRGSCGVA